MSASCTLPSGSGSRSCGRSSARPARCPNRSAARSRTSCWPRRLAALREVQELGLVRKEVDVSVAADFIRDSIHSAMLRHTLYRTDPETVDAHLRGITDIFYRGIKANHLTES